MIKDPLGTEIPKGWGGANRKTFRGRGMDIFWNHTIDAGSERVKA